MKRIQSLLLIALLALFAAGCGSPSSDKALTVILTEPTVGNLNTIRFLTERKIFDVPENTKYICVYHPSQRSRFDRTERYITENDLSDFILQRVEGELNEENLFVVNGCTDTFRELFSQSDGIIFFGGPDIPPSVFGEENTLSVVTDSGRHYFELSFLFHLLGSSRNSDFVPLLEEKPDYLVTGFCLGMQTMNIATGGSLYQDIPADIYGITTPEEKVAMGQENLHRNYWQRITRDSLFMSNSFHSIQFTDHSFFGKTISLSKDLRPLIYSSHHQSVKAIGKGFEVTALSSDGKVIEGIAHSTYPNVFAVQFHPEVTSLYEDRAVRRFAPTDEPRTYHQIIEGESLEFHLAYWKHISESLKDSGKKGRR